MILPRIPALMSMMICALMATMSQPTAASAQEFKMSGNMYSSHGGRPISDLALSQQEISDLLSMVLSTGLDDEDMRSAAALRKELDGRHIDMGEGADKGLILQGTHTLCGATGNCATWLFRRAGTTWKLLGPRNSAPLAASFGFTATKHNNLRNLVIFNNTSAGSGTVEVWQFNGTVYESKECYSQEGSSLVPARMPVISTAPRECGKFLASPHSSIRPIFATVYSSC